MNILKELIESREQEKLSWKEKEVSIQKEFESELEKAFKKKFPKRKFSLIKSSEINQPEHGEIYNKWLPLTRELYKAHKAYLKRIDAKIKTRCELINDIPQSEEKTYWSYIYRGAYRSQGWGEFKYSKQAAQGYIDHAEIYGIKAEMEILEHQINIYAYTTVEGIEILNNRPSVDLKTFLNNCWSQGVNPRVYNPFIPTGLEEKLGINYHGGRGY